MASKAPAFQFYANDFKIDTDAMSLAARGGYISMLAASWTLGPIADTPKSITTAMGWGPTDGAWETIWNEIKPLWTLTPGGWTNQRLEDTRNEQAKYRELQAAKGRKGGRPKADEKPEESRGLDSALTGLKPEESPSSSPLTFDLDLRSSSSPLPEGGELPAPDEIAALVAIAPFDRTPEQGERLNELRGGPALLPRGSKPIKQSQNSIAYREVTCRKHYGQGALPSCHRGVCVPAFLGLDWESQCGGDSAYVRAFIADVCRGITGPVGDDPLKFWRAQWQAKHGSSVPREPRSNGERTVDAANRLAARYEREGRL